MRISEAVQRYKAAVVADTANDAGERITTVRLRCPASLLAQLNTHAALCKSAASARAIPLAVFRKQVLDDPYIPMQWGKNQKGMMASEKISDDEEATRIWLDSRDMAITQHRQLEALGVHKQNANRILEPWAWKDVVITATDWEGFFALRCTKEAQEDMAGIAWSIFAVVMKRVPNKGRLHLPFVDDDEMVKINEDDLYRVSAARCARVSYQKHGAACKSIDDDLELAQKLASDLHASPFEHAAISAPFQRHQKYLGWKSMRAAYMPNGGKAQLDWAKALAMLESDCNLIS